MVFIPHGKARKPAPRWLLTIFLVIGVGLQTAGAVSGVRMAAWLRTASATTGKVVDLERRRSSKGGRSYAEVVVFQPESGDEVRFKSSISTSSPFAVGDTVPVLYNPKQPDDAMIDTQFRRWFLPGLFFAMGLVFTLVGWGGSRSCKR